MRFNLSSVQGVYCVDAGRLSATEPDLGCREGQSGGESDNTSNHTEEKLDILDTADRLSNQSRLSNHSNSTHR